MRLIGAFVMAVLLFGGFLTRNAGSAGGGAEGERSRRIEAAPADVMAVVRASLPGEGFTLVSRADDGDRYRMVVTSHEFAADEETERMARLGDLIMTARVDEDELEVRTSFTQVSTTAGYRILVTPEGDGKSSRVTLTPRIEQGSGPEAERLARNLRTLLDRHARETLDRLATAVRS
jgi:hypothetical protein